MRKHLSKSSRGAHQDRLDLIFLHGIRTTRTERSADAKLKRQDSPDRVLSRPKPGWDFLLSQPGILQIGKPLAHFRSTMKDGIANNSTASISQARKSVEQLKMEACMDRIKVSKAGCKDLMAYCDAHITRGPPHHTRSPPLRTLSGREVLLQHPLMSCGGAARVQARRCLSSLSSPHLKILAIWR
ncbi:hypothetical protein KUCAC02_024181 [Chaenocephalus aceratus]|uniref:Uncharacterized protein n=1 Tax=Chaenocephalus aceratus TaxID=36190 RepID=A0ACB9WH17_CHAAC|nr:hypothetical protein KUCAC02_024181 [Chaenocephalus aceratus]